MAAHSIAAMFHATLVCTDEGCAVEVEAWGELHEFEAMVCDGCDCTLLVLSLGGVEPPRVVHLPQRSARLARAA